MSLRSAKNYLITFDTDAHSDFFYSVINQGITFEVLNQDELGEEWQTKTVSVSVGNDDQKSTRDGELNLLASILKYYEPKGIFSGFMDTRFVGDSGDIEKAQNNKGHIISQARILHKYHLNELKIREITKIQNNQKAEKSYICGYNLGNFAEGLGRYVTNIVEKFNENHPKQAIDLTTPEMTLVSMNGFDLIEYKTEDQDIIAMFIKDDYTAVKSLSEFAHWLDEQSEGIEKEAQSKNLDLARVSNESLKSISALHASLEIEQNVREISTKLFQTESKGAVFCFISIASESVLQFEKYLSTTQVKAQEVNWNKDIFVWKHKGGLNAFQSIAQSVGTIGRTEADPTGLIAIFFSIFFAFCLGDAFYGLFLALFCGYFLIFTRLKSGFKGMFRLFAISGLATVLFGVLTNTYAGDLLNYVGLGDVVQNAQLINVLDAQAPVPINIFLKNNGGTSPIIALLGIAVVIGVINLLSGYMLKIVTSIRSKEFGAARAEIMWLVFIASLVGVTVGSVMPQIFSVTLVLFLIATVGLFVFNQGKGIAGKLVGGLGSVYGLIGLGADILSYTRLVAVGLTGGIIANVINLLANLMFTSINIPVLNVIAAIIVLLIGHTFNIVISLFGAYINPLRLHYVEFFPKFFEGRGREFKPSVQDLTFFQTTNLPTQT